VATLSIQALILISFLLDPKAAGYSVGAQAVRNRIAMKASEQRIDPEEYILAVLSPQERLDAALRVAREAFRETALTLEDVESAVRKVRRKQYAKKQVKTKSRH
jgi:hypothetical protein